VEFLRPPFCGAAFINNLLFIKRVCNTHFSPHLSPLILTLYCKQFFIAMKNFMQPNARASPALEVSRFSVYYYQEIVNGTNYKRIVTLEMIYALRGTRFFQRVTQLGFAQH
jgi:hypothetical protein